LERVAASTHKFFVAVFELLLLLFLHLLMLLATIMILLMSLLLMLLLALLLLMLLTLLLHLFLLLLLYGDSVNIGPGFTRKGDGASYVLKTAIRFMEGQRSAKTSDTGII